MIQNVFVKVETTVTPAKDKNERKGKTSGGRLEWHLEEVPLAASAGANVLPRPGPPSCAFFIFRLTRDKPERRDGS